MKTEKKKRLIDEVTFDYSKMMKMIRKRRITFGSFCKKVGLSEYDIYRCQMGGLMTLEGEMRAAIFLQCKLSDLREMHIPPDYEKRQIGEYLEAGHSFDELSPELQKMYLGDKDAPST